jgi:hypothetical protein
VKEGDGTMDANYGERGGGGSIVDGYWKVVQTAGGYG